MIVSDRAEKIGSVGPSDHIQIDYDGKLAIMVVRKSGYTAEYSTDDKWSVRYQSMYPVSSQA